MKTRIDPKAVIGFSDLIKQFYYYKNEELQKLGVKISHCRMLHLLSDHNGIRQQDIVGIAAVSRSTVSESLSEMVKEGYIERHSTKEDKRVSLIVLTEAGLEKAAVIRDLFDEFCNWCMRDFSEEEAKQFACLLQKFRFDN